MACIDDGIYYGDKDFDAKVKLDMYRRFCIQEE